MKYAIIKDHTVSNIIEYDGNSKLIVDGDLVPADDKAYIGGECMFGVFTPQPVVEQEAPEPSEAELMRESAMNKLRALGLTDAEIEAIIG